MSEDLKQKISKAAPDEMEHPDPKGNAIIYLCAAIVVLSTLIHLINSIWPFL